jgi:hypothetical protein
VRERERLSGERYLKYRTSSPAILMDAVKNMKNSKRIRI